MYRSNTRWKKLRILTNFIVNMNIQNNYDYEDKLRLRVKAVWSPI